MQKLLVTIVGMVLLFPNNSTWAAGLTCQQIQASIKKHGSVILRYPSRNGGPIQRYDRFVANLEECPTAFNTLRVRHIPAFDTDACPVHICWTED
ncbi:MAG: hypothetical protein CMH69_20055 [Nitratireductor sp.]|nr:hypothetical protein [Nitratireductor sp.]